MEFCKKLDLTGVEITGKWKADIPPTKLSKKYLKDLLKVRTLV